MQPAAHVLERRILTMKQINTIRGMIISHIRGEAEQMRHCARIIDQAISMTVGEVAVFHYNQHKSRRDMAISILADVPKPEEAV